MPALSTCSRCGAKFQRAEGGKSRLCARCARARDTHSTPPTDDAPPVLSTLSLTLARGLLLVSLIWLAAGWFLSLLVPWLVFHPLATLLRLVPPLVTGTLILANIWLALRLLAATGRALAVFPATVLQVLLFTLLFFQIAANLGMQHYEVDGAPRWWHWLGFSAAHALRASDVIDIVEAYGLRVQAIQHASVVVALLLVAYHLVVDILILSLLVVVIDRLREWYLDDEDRRDWARLIARCAFGAWVLLTLLTAFLIHRWHPLDIPLWLLDNVLRVLDVGDAMECFHVRLHQIPTHWWEGTLTLLGRIFLVLWLGPPLARLSQVFRLRYLGGLGLSREEIRALRSASKDEAFRAQASAILAQRKQAASVTLVPHQHARWMVPALGLGAAIVILVVMLLPSWNQPIETLTEEAAGPDEERAVTALEALRRMGPLASSAGAQLTQLEAKTSTERRPHVIAALAAQGAEATAPLRAILDRGDPNASLQVVRTSQQLGPKGASVLLRATQLKQPAVKSEAEQALRALGADAVPVLLDTVQPETLRITWDWLEQLDRNWRLRTTRNPTGRTLIKEHDRIVQIKQALREGKWEERVKAAEEAGTLGTNTILFIPDLMEAMKDPSPKVQLAILKAFAGLGPAAVEALPVITGCFTRATSVEAVHAAAETLGQLGASAASAAPLLVERISDPAFKVSVRPALARLGRGALPALLPKLDDPDIRVKADVLDVLVLMGPEAGSVVPTLVQRLRFAGELRMKMIQTILATLDPATDATPANQATFQVVLDEIEKGAALSWGYGASIGPRDGERLTQVILARLPQSRSPGSLIQCLGELRRGARAALPTLRQYLNRPGIGEVARGAIALIEKDLAQGQPR